MASRDRRSTSDEGAAAVEFALVSLLLVTLLLGLIAFGFGLFRQQSALHAAREGARLAATGVNSCVDWKSAVVARGQGANLTAADVHLTIADDSSNGILGLTKKATVTVDFTVDLSYLGFLGFAVLDGHQTAHARVEKLGSVTTSC